MPNESKVQINEKKPYSETMFGIPVILLLLGLVSLLNDFSSEMILPILPFFIASLGGTAAIVGLIGGFSDALASFLKLASGYLSDKQHRKKPFIVFGYGLTSFTKMFYIFANSWPFIFFLRSFDRVGKGIREAPRDALISVVSRTHGKMFGIHRVMDTMGAILGTIATMIVIYFFGMNYQIIFVIAAVIAFISLIPLWFVKEEKEADANHLLKVDFNVLGPKLLFVLFVFGLFNLGNFTYMLFIMKAQLQFGLAEGILIVLSMYLLYNISMALFSYPVGEIYDKIGKYAIIIGFALFAITCIGFVYATSLFWLIILFIVYGLFNAFIDGNARAFISDLSKEEIRGTALGTYHFVSGIVALPSSFIAGLLWDSISPNAPFVFGFIIAIVSVLLLMFVKVEN